MTSLVHAFGGGSPVWLGPETGTVFVRELTIGDLLDLQLWAAMVSPSPWDMPEAPDHETFVGAFYERASKWPPRIDTREAETLLGSPLILARTLTLSPGLDSSEALSVANWLVTDKGRNSAFLLRQAWDGTFPSDLATRFISLSLGREADPAGPPTNWPELVGSLMEHRSMTPAEIKAMTLTELRTLCDKGDGRSGSYRFDQVKRIAAMRAKGRTWLKGLEGDTRQTNGQV